MMVEVPNVRFAIQNFLPVVRDLHVAEQLVGFVLGFDDSLMAGDGTFKFFPHI